MGVLEVVAECPGALDAGIGERADLLTVEPAPLLAIELVVEGEDELGVDEVDEGVTHVAGVVVVDGQVEEVELQPEVLVELFEQQLLRVLVGDVADHEGGPPVVLDLRIKWATFSGSILYSLAY